jgi:hypothetical protein
MLYSRSPPLADELQARETPAGRVARDLDGRPEPRFGRRPANASIHSLPPPRPRPSIGRRMFRTLTRFTIAVLIGVGATLGWQAYGDEARQMLAVQAPDLARMLPASVMKPQAVAARPASPALELGPLASNLEIVRRSVEQLAARQEQLAQNIAAMRAVDEDIRMKLALAAQPPGSVQFAAPGAQPKPAQAKPQPAGTPVSSAPRPAPGAAPVSILPSR